MLLSRAWTYFEAAARHGSLRGASDELNVAASAVGAQVAQLEEDVGARLFDRMPRGMRLTSAGEMLLHHGRRAALELDRGRSFVEKLRGDESGATSLATVEGLAQGLVADALSEMWSRRPALRVTLQTVTSSRAFDLIDDGICELGLSYLRKVRPYVKILGMVQLEIGVLLPANHPLAGKSSVAIPELLDTGTPLLLSDTSVNVREMLEAAVGRRALTILHRITSNSTAVLTQLVVRGAGAAIRTRIPTSDDAQPNVAFCALRELREQTQDLALYCHPDVPLSPPGEALAGALRIELDRLHPVA